MTIGVGLAPCGAEERCEVALPLGPLTLLSTKPICTFGRIYAVVSLELREQRFESVGPGAVNPQRLPTLPPPHLYLYQ